LAYFPAFTLEELGLVHLHLFITEPNSGWFRFPYAVESQWVTQNLVDHVLYLHCFVPLAHQERVERLIRELQIPHKGLHAVWSSSSWQRLRLGSYESLSQGFPVHTWPNSHDGHVPSRHALAIPVLAEAWNRQSTLDDIWQRLRRRLGGQLKAYFPGRRPYAINGKTHVKEIYGTLARDRLFRQYLVRIEEECSLLVISPSYSQRLPPDVSNDTRVAELFPASGGGSLWRLQGSWELLRSRASLAGHAVFLVEQDTAPEVRFCYEWLFDPAASCWRFSSERILAHMGGNS